VRHRQHLIGRHLALLFSATARAGNILECRHGFCSLKRGYVPGEPRPIMVVILGSAPFAFYEQTHQARRAAEKAIRVWTETQLGPDR
jgi:hypothetical protein